MIDVLGLASGPENLVRVVPAGLVVGHIAAHQHPLDDQPFCSSMQHS